MSVNAINTALSGMQANQFRVDTAANNIANVNTEGFQPRSVQTVDQAYINDIGQGTRVAATPTYGPPAATRIDDPLAATAETANEWPGNAGGGTVVTAQAGGGGTVVTAQDGAVAMSNTDLVREMTSMAAAGTAYAANAALAGTANEMGQTLLDLHA